MKTTKFVTVVAATAALATLTACGSNQSSELATPTSSTASNTNSQPASRQAGQYLTDPAPIRMRILGKPNDERDVSMYQVNGHEFAPGQRFNITKHWDIETIYLKAKENCYAGFMGKECKFAGELTITPHWENQGYTKFEVTGQWRGKRVDKTVNMNTNRTQQSFVLTKGQPSVLQFGSNDTSGPREVMIALKPWG